MSKKLIIISVSVVFFTTSFFLRGFFISQSVIVNENRGSLEIALGERKGPFLHLFGEVREKLVADSKSFLEANLAEMKVKVWKNGFIIGEFDILEKDNSDDWGKSAAGLYKILPGRDSGFSIVPGLNNEYGLHYYGNYYIKGDSLLELGSSAPDSSILLEDKDIEEIYKMINLGMPILVIDDERGDYEYTRKRVSNAPETSAQSYLVADLDTGYVFAEKNSQTQFPIASLTKLMTATVITENIDLEDSIEVNEEMLNAYGVTEILEVGKKYNAGELLYPLMIESSNDTAEILSRFLGRDRTVRLMNEKANAILMNQTSFVDPSGLSAGNVSTAQDLFYLARYIYKNKYPLLDISKGIETTVAGGINLNIDEFYNKNIFINDPTSLGGKTGYIIASKQTGVFFFRFEASDGEKRDIVFILLKSTGSKSDTQRLYGWIMRDYGLKPSI